ncbi:hypothetical protein YTPLAS73_09870 [Nitrosarchaeum sp.]|nr:hypothetical protein YTPLAS73_09870 [Nitrosarchaeum sp.]
MTIKKSTTKTKNLKSEKMLRRKNPNVIVDFECKDGMLFIVIENIGNDPAYDTLVKFNKKISGMQKTKNISSLRIFQQLKFLPPGKKIKMFVDLFQFYLASKQPMQIKTIIFFRNELKEVFQKSIQHDLSIYKDFVEIYHDKETI